ncbi:prolyl oligopeptidase family serine peptidase [Ideonella sp. 4Y11]|uniref:Prolyl oligopeptidase family serine peptidase n=1 Tax=Ideonella aquatica TaxID=2824119 RepID=A0A940YIY7_9BURK|nr:PHB depolymerase family esterase [Ideonella aquatica]MBQ0958941.1 prolyl oligopeptidase family serine peptidase [Ideonella aquatica]
MPTILRPLLLLLFLGSATAARGAPMGAGTHEWRLDWAGQSRSVIVHVPPGLPAGQAAPLVLALHGGGGHAAFMADDERYGLSRQADRSGFVVAYPNGFSRLPGGRFATWNAGGCCGAARDRGSDDVGFIRAVVASVRERIAVDPARIFATGMSNGGMLAHRLACDGADLFRAVAAVAGTDATRQCTPSRPVSVLHIHARDDTHVLFNGGAGPNAFRDRDAVMDFVSVPDTIARWTQRNRCSGPPRRILDRPGAVCEEHSDCAAGSRVRLCVTDTGGHAWPGAEQVRRGKPAASTALDANEAIWRFFEAVSGPSHAPAPF